MTIGPVPNNYYEGDVNSECLNVLQYPCFYLNSKFEVIYTNQAARDRAPQLCEPGELTCRLRANNIVRDNLIHRRSASMVLYDLPPSYRCLNLMPLRQGYICSLCAPPCLAEHPVGFAEQLREPLAEIFATLPILSQHLTQSDDPHHLQRINRSCYQLLRNSNMVAKLSRISRGAMGDELLNLGKMANELCRAFGAVALAGTPAVHCSIPEQPLVVRGDAELLGSLLENLLSNALRFTRDGNEIHICVRQLGSRCLLSVRDHGSGIRPEVLPHVFDPYYSAPIWPDDPTPSLGLGLSYIHSLVTLMGGTVTLESVWGEGTCVTVALPLAADKPAGAEHSAAEYLTNRYSSMFVELYEFCTLPMV